MCCSRPYYWLNTHALLLSFQAKSKIEREAAKLKCAREAELVSEVVRLKSQVADLLPYKAKYELGEEKKKKQKKTK